MVLRGSVSVLALLTVALTACSAAPADVEDSESSESAVVDSKKFAMHPGVERIAQHKGLGMSVSDTAVQQKSIDKDNVYWLARLSELVYKTPAEIKAGLAEIGLPNDEDHFRFFEDKATGTEALYVTTASLSKPPAAVDNPWNAASPDVAILAFRGTEVSSLKDIGRDLMFWKESDRTLGRVHSGFAGGVESVWGKLDGNGLSAFLRKHHSFDSTGAKPKRLGAELYLTGHSLGAALATVALARTSMESCHAQAKFTSEDKCFLTYTPVSGLVTFGSPRVADGGFAKTMSTWMRDRTPIFRVVHGKDGVTKVPKIDFKHIGFEGDEKAFRVHIVPPGQITIGQGDDEGDGDGSLFGDHKMSGYVPLLETLSK